MSTAPTSITQKAIAIGIFSESTKLCARSKTLADGTSRAARNATVAARRPSTRTVALPRRAPPSHRSLHFARGPHVDGEALATTQADDDAVRGAQRQVPIAGSEPKPSRARSPARIGRRRPYWRKPYSSSSRLSLKRSSSVGAPIATEISSTPPAPPRPDQHVEGAEGVPGLHPRHPGAHEEQLVDRLDPPPRPHAAQDGAARVGDAGEGRDRQQAPGQGRQVASAGVVAALVEADRVGVVGVGETEGGRVSVHLRHEPPLRAGRGQGEVVGGVVAAAQDQAVEQVADADRLTGAEVEQGLAVFGLVGGGAHDAIERQLFQRHVRGHQLRRAGDRKVPGDGMGGQHVTCPCIDQRPSARLDRGPLRFGTHRADEQDGRKQGKQQDARPTGRKALYVSANRPVGPHGGHGHRSFSVSPAIRICGSTCGLSASIRTTGTPVRWAIAIRVSPLCTT